MLEQEESAKDLLDRLYNLFVPSDNDAQSEPLQRLIDFLNTSSQVIDHLQVEDTAEENQTESIFSGKSVLATIAQLINCALDNPEMLAQRYAAFSHHILEIVRGRSSLEPDPGDRRFRDPLWKESFFLRALVQIYLTWQQELQLWLCAQPLTQADKMRAEFILRQLVAALAPSNFPLNPSALKRAEKTQGKSFVAGIINWLQDVNFNHCMPQQIKRDAYTLGKDLAATNGSVVYRNDLLELIQYQPQTAKVHRKPILLIPPQINKYYIFDLSPKNSLLGYLVQQGLQMFVVSWRNPHATNGNWSLETYLMALLEAILAIQEICRSKKIGIISACAGGLTTQVLVGYLAKVKKLVWIIKPFSSPH